MKKTVKKLMVTLALALMVTAFCGSGVQAKQKSQKLKVDNIYADYNKYVKGRCNLKKYRLVIKQGSKVLHNKTHYRKSFSVKIGTRNQGDKITVKIRKSRKKYASVTKQVKQTLWWQKDGYKSEKAVVKAYKTNDRKITVHCKAGYRLNVDITGNNGKSQNKSNIQKTKTINVASGIDSIKKVTLTLYSNKKKISSNSITPDDVKSDTGKGNKPGVKKDNNSSDTKKDDTSSVLTVNKFLSNNKGKDIYRLNDYTIYDGERYDGAGYYGIVINYLYNDIDWYSKKEYDEIIGEAKRIVEEAGVSDDMTDQEKAWRIGRTVIYNIDYVVGCNIYKIHDAMFKKETVCAGYSTTYAFLCRYVGIDCDYVRSETHAWNLVKLGDYYYVTDLTGAYFEKNILTSDGVGEFFKERNYSNSMNEIWPCYKTEQYTKTHPVSEIDYFTRCKNEGTSYLSEKELYNLFH